MAEPGAFEFQHQAGKTHRRVTTEWRADRVASTAVPPFKSLGEPPASEADKRLAADPLTRLVQMTGLTAPETACRRSYTFFDGKQLYAVDLSNPRPAQAAPLSALASPTLCDGAYRQIAGFGRPKPGQEDHGLKSRISLTFGRVGPAGPWVLAEVSARTKLGSARIVLRSVRLGDQPAG